MQTVFRDRPHGGRLDKTKRVKLAGAAGISPVKAGRRGNLYKGMSRLDPSPRVVTGGKKAGGLCGCVGRVFCSKKVSGRKVAVFVAVRGTMVQQTRVFLTVTTRLM